MLFAFVEEVTVVVKVIGSSVSAPTFPQRWYAVTIAESTPRLTNFLNVTATSDPSGTHSPPPRRLCFYLDLFVGLTITAALVKVLWVFDWLRNFWKGGYWT